MTKRQMKQKRAQQRRMARRRKRRHHGGHFAPGWSARTMTRGELERFMRTMEASGGLVVGPAELELGSRVIAALDAYDYEVSGRTEPDLAIAVLHAAITEQLWADHREAANWEGLDVDRVLDLCASHPECLGEQLHVHLRAFVTWLANNQHLDPARARHMLDRITRREPESITRMRAAVADMPRAELDRYETARLARLASLEADLN